MQLIIGGAYQGKKAYVLEQYGLNESDVINGETCNLMELGLITVLDQFHCYVKRLMQAGNDPKVEVEKLLEQSPKLIVISNELGCGLVPIDPFDRAYREMTGRLLCELAKKAETVTRVYCGIGRRIK